MNAQDRQLMQQALDALEVATTPLAKDRQEVLRAQAALRKRLSESVAQPEQQESLLQEIARLHDRIKDLENDVEFLSRPAQQERGHSTDGHPCWCNPDVIEEDDGKVIVHNYGDNWQQYAKPGETAQQCIERHRAEQDALLNLLKQAREPLTQDMVQSCPYDGETLRGAYFEGWLKAEAAHGITSGAATLGEKKWPT